MHAYIHLARLKYNNSPVCKERQALLSSSLPSYHHLPPQYPTPCIIVRGQSEWRSKHIHTLSSSSRALRIAKKVCLPTLFVVFIPCRGVVVSITYIILLVRARLLSRCNMPTRLTHTHTHATTTKMKIDT